MPGIIDIHAHAFPDALAEKAVQQIGNHYSLKMNGKGTLSDLLESAERSKIDYIVFHATATKPAQVPSINNWIIENTGGRLIGFGTLRPDYEDSEAEFERILTAGIKGIKLHPDFQRFYPIVYHETELNDFYKLGLDEDERADILYQNAAGLLGL